MQDCKRPPEAKTILKKNKKCWKIQTSGFKTYNKVTIIKTGCCWHKDRHIDQWNRIDSPEINPYTYGQLILTRVPRPFSGEIIVISSADGTGRTENPQAKKKKERKKCILTSHYIQKLTKNGAKN